MKTQFIPLLTKLSRINGDREEKIFTHKAYKNKIRCLSTLFYGEYENKGVEVYTSKNVKWYSDTK